MDRSQSTGQALNPQRRPAQGTAALMWSKLTTARWEDAWVERLQFLGPGRLAIFTLPGARRIRIEAYGLSKRDAERLVTAFGGQSRVMKGVAEMLAKDDGKPLLIRDRLIVVRSQARRGDAARQYPERPILVIPAEMAFGTGDHATTATCLRLVADYAAQQAGRKWEALDLGTGTGILALAARRLGASRCDAWDFDPACVKAARRNAKLNGLKVPAARVDVTQWTPARQWRLVIANLYSDMLMKVSGKIVAALEEGGSLILSGMLSSQAEGTLAEFSKAGIRFTRVVKKGKWVSAIGARATALKRG